MDPLDDDTPASPPAAAAVVPPVKGTASKMRGTLGPTAATKPPKPSPRPAAAAAPTPAPAPAPAPADVAAVDAAAATSADFDDVFDPADAAAAIAVTGGATAGEVADVGAVVAAAAPTSTHVSDSGGLVAAVVEPVAAIPSKVVLGGIPISTDDAARTETEMMLERHSALVQRWKDARTAMQPEDRVKALQPFSSLLADVEDLVLASINI